MADITYSVSVRHATFPVDNTTFSGRGTITQVGAEASKQIVTASTSWPAVKNCAFTSESLIAIQNLDATNYVQVALDDDDTEIFARILPLGSPLLLPVLDSAVYYIKANSAACDVAVWATEA
jgi:hypothetical protein